MSYMPLIHLHHVLLSSWHGGIIVSFSKISVRYFFSFVELLVDFFPEWTAPPTEL